MLQSSSLASIETDYQVSLDLSHRLLRYYSLADCHFSFLCLLKQGEVKPVLLFIRSPATGRAFSHHISSTINNYVLHQAIVSRLFHHFPSFSLWMVKLRASVASQRSSPIPSCALESSPIHRSLLQVPQGIISFPHQLFSSSAPNLIILSYHKLSRQSPTLSGHFPCF